MPSPCRLSIKFTNPLWTPHLEATILHITKRMDIKHGKYPNNKGYIFNWFTWIWVSLGFFSLTIGQADKSKNLYTSKNKWSNFIKAVQCTVLFEARRIWLKFSPVTIMLWSYIWAFAILVEPVWSCDSKGLLAIHVLGKRLLSHEHSEHL